jgi:hypothetical protein
MSVESFVPEIWSSMLIEPFKKALVFGNLVNRNVEGEIKFGRSVHIPELGALTASAYTGSVTYGSIPDADRVLLIDQKPIVAVEIDDIGKVQSKPELVAPLMRQMSDAIQQYVDDYIGSLYAGAGITTGLGDDTTEIEINSANVLTYLTMIGQKMTENNVPKAGRWIVIPPWFETKLLLAKLTKDTDNSKALADGFFGKVCGFDVYTSNNVDNDGSTYHVLAGVSDSITFAGQLEKVEALRLTDKMSDGLRSLYVFGAKVVRANSLACLTCDEKAEA